MNEHEQVRGWSASYVLGALDPEERRRFEAHLVGCDQCRGEVAEFAPIPALLARAPHAEPVAAPDRIADVAARRVRADWSALTTSRRRWRWGAAVASGAALVAATVAAGAVAPLGPEGTALLVTGGRVASATVQVDPRAWGSAVHLDLTGLPARGGYVAWVIGPDGEQQQVAAWGPTPTGQAAVTGASSVPVEALVEVRVTSEDPRDLLLTARGSRT